MSVPTLAANFHASDLVWSSVTRGPTPYVRRPPRTVSGTIRLILTPRSCCGARRGTVAPVRDTPPHCGRTSCAPRRSSRGAGAPGEPAHSSFRPITLPGVSRPPAPSMPPSSITAPSSTVAEMPTKARFFSVQAWMTALWPTVTSSPMMVETSPESTWMIAPSWMLVRAPMRMILHVAAHQAMEPDAGLRADHDVADHRRGRRDEGIRRNLRRDAVQREDRPLAAQRRGVAQPRVRHAPPPCRAAPLPRDRQAEHQAKVLHRRAGRALAEIVQPRDQHRLAMLLVGMHREFQQVGVVQRLRLQLAVRRRAPRRGRTRSPGSAPPARHCRSAPPGLPCSVSRCSGTETSMPWR